MAGWGGYVSEVRAGEGVSGLEGYLSVGVSEMGEGG